jgi:Domain of unknown function (DUF4335)
MNSPNLQPRQFVHNTCELSIDDKKSPFPAWMKFNKPNPLRFSLTVNDPDRPELEPMQVEGDRTKLESLHRTVEDYVKNLVARAPLPQINGEDSSRLPKSTAFDDTINSSDLQHRPIDALKVNDEKPRIEADGLSRHLFYLGSGADANTTIMSLSTLQLFDLSSALSEGMTPIIEPEAEPEQPVALASTAETLVQPVVLPPEAVTNSNKNSATTSLNSEKSEVEEPKVVLPSANKPESGSSEDLYGLETESSILERSNPSKDRFKMPKPSLGSLNLPELPDFSRSPLTSIPLWLGLGGMAALIIAFPFLSSQFKGGNSVAKKPTTPTTQVATAPTDIPTPYQPNDPIITSGVGTPSAGLPTPSTTLGGIGAGGLNSQVGGNPLGQNSNPNLGGASTAIPKNGSIGSGNPIATNPNTRYPFNSSINQQTGLPNQSDSNNPASAKAQAIAAAKAQQAQALAAANANKPRKGPSDGSSSALPSRSLPQSNVGDIADGYDPRLKPLTDDTPEKKVSRSRTRQKPLLENSEPNSDFPNSTIIGQGNDLGGGGSGLFNTPVAIPKVDSAKNLEVPTSPSESVQAKGLQGYFQGRWRADPNFDGSLQYKVNVGRNGKVVSLEGVDERSRVYLNKTSFLKPGEAVSKNAQQDQKVWLILNSTGDVQTLADGE